MTVSPASPTPNLAEIFDAIGVSLSAQISSQLETIPESLQAAALQLPALQDLYRTQQVHALEHATIWVLSNHPEVLLTPGQSTASAKPKLQDDRRFHGLSTAKGFLIYGPTSTVRLNWSVKTALRQLQAGETQLALHPRCGTHLAAQAFLTAGLATASLALMPPKPWAQLAGLVGAIATAAELSPSLGNWCQANLTTALPHALQITAIRPIQDPAGNPAHFVSVSWPSPEKASSPASIPPY